MSKRAVLTKTGIPAVKNTGVEIFDDIRKIIESARVRVATYVNTELTMLYWKVGERIRREILREKRAEYGQEIVATLSQQFCSIRATTLFTTDSFKASVSLFSLF